MKKKSILKNAKKLLALVPFASAALIMVGCAKKTEPKPTTHTDPIVTTTEKPTTTEHKDDPIVKTYANVGELMEEKASSIYSLLENYVSDTFETSTGISYDAENIIFSAVDVDETATTLTNADYTFAYKSGETERKYFTATAEFNEVSLADLADGKTTNFYLEDATTKSQQTYDAKEKQNDTDFLANLYSQNNDKVFKTYTAETFEEDEKIESVEQLIAEHGEEAYDTIMNSDFYENNIVKKVYGRYYGTDYLTINDVDIDFGSTSADGKIHDLQFRITIQYKDTQNKVLFVKNLNFAQGISYNDILDENILNNTDCTYSNVYSFTYAPSIQGTRSALMQAIANVAVNDGFEYGVDDILFVQQGDSTDATLGSVSDFRLSINTNKGIRHIKVFVAKASSDEGLVNQINNGRYKVCEYLESANFTDNFITNAQEIENGI